MTHEDRPGDNQAIRPRELPQGTIPGSEGSDRHGFIVPLTKLGQLAAAVGSDPLGSYGMPPVTEDGNCVIHGLRRTPSPTCRVAPRFIRSAALFQNERAGDAPGPSVS